MAETYYVLKINYLDRPAETRNIKEQITVVGRDQGDIVLGDTQASGRHAEIHFVNGRVTVKDLGSTNGVIYNGTRVPQFAVSPGQSFVCGQTTLTLMSVHGGPKAAFGGGKTMIAMGAPPMPGRPPSMGAPGSLGSLGGAPAGRPPMAVGAPVGGPGLGAPPPPAGGAPGGLGLGGPPPGGLGGPPPGGLGGPPPGGLGVPGGAPAPINPAPAPINPAPAPVNPAPSPLVGGPMPPSGGGGLAPASPATPAMSSGLTEPVRPDFNGTGGELLVTYLVGLLLTMITFGIYLPWFVVKLRKFQYDNTMIKGLPGGQMRMAFTGTGGELFVRGLVGYLLTAITLGIYGPWFICNLIDYFAENTTFTTASGKQYRLNFKGKGGELFVTFLVGMILTGITFGIYAPWFSCKLQKWINNNIEIYEDGSELVGQADFVGTGGELFVVNLVGMLLTMITFGIYFPWFQVNLVKFNTHNTRINVKGRTIVPKFSGTGGELFVEFLVGYLLTLVTLGIYSPWWAVKLMKFNINNLSFEDVGQTAIGAGASGQLRS